MPQTHGMQAFWLADNILTYLSQLLIHLEALQRQQLCLKDSATLLSFHFILNPESLTNADGLLGIPWWFDG